MSVRVCEKMRVSVSETPFRFNPSYFSGSLPKLSSFPLTVSSLRTVSVCGVIVLCGSYYGQLRQRHNSRCIVFIRLSMSQSVNDCCISVVYLSMNRRGI